MPNGANNWYVETYKNSFIKMARILKLCPKMMSKNDVQKLPGHSKNAFENHLVNATTNVQVENVPNIQQI